MTADSAENPAPTVQEGIVERVTGAGKLVVEPAGENPALRVGDEVIDLLRDN